MVSQLAEQFNRLPDLLAAHVWLVVVSVGLACVVSVPAGVWVAHRPRWRGVVLGAAGLIQTVPGMALLAAVVLGLMALSAAGVWRGSTIGAVPTLAALVLYALLPVVRNTVVGVRGVKRDLVDAAEGLGMARWRVRWVIELPLAAAVVWAGVRTATVWTVGLATLSEPVGQPSLGTMIFGGLRTINGASIAVGCVAAAGLALVLDRALGLAEAGRWRWAIGVVAALLIGVTAWSWSTTSATRTAAADGSERVDLGRAFVVGSKDFGESEILAQLTGQWLGNAAGFDHRRGMGGMILFDALTQGDVDAYVEYTGTVWATVMQREDLPGRSAILAQMAGYLQAEHGVVSAAPLGFENAYCMAVRKETAEKYGLKGISDLAKVSPELKLGSDPEFFQRQDWVTMRDAYGLKFKDLVSMTPTLMYDALKNKEVDVITAYTTDGRIAAYGFVVLPDDRGVLPPYDAVLLMGPSVANDGAVLRRLERLAGTLTATTMQEANRRVDIDGQSPGDVAAWLIDGIKGEQHGAATRPSGDE
ncbi:MAG: ABC transporter permease/substrate-binding protein [Planctomycetota bacterium]